MFIVRHALDKKLFLGAIKDASGWRYCGRDRPHLFDTREAALADISIREKRWGDFEAWQIYEVTYGLVWIVRRARDTCRPYCLDDKRPRWTDDRKAAKRWNTATAARAARGDWWSPKAVGGERSHARVVRFLRRVA